LPASDAAEYEARVNKYIAKNAEQREKMLKRSLSKSTSSKSEKSTAEKPVLHEYNLASYGLSEELVRVRFEKYIQEFHLEKK